MRPDVRGSARSERVVSLLVFAILGAGFVLLFADVGWFWMVWVLGFAVVLPAVAVLLGVDDGDADADAGRDREREPARARDRESESDVSDALDTLRDRYARGDLSEEQFEAKLEALLETETPEDARERLRRRRAGREEEAASTSVEFDADRE
jgi:uncharacterized membrane protein